jgi:valine dehydrogenase (NAD+)
VTGVFDRIAPSGHEQVAFCQDRGTGLRAIIAIHSTALGPALGGTRFHAYASEEDALADALRLSRAMTYKHAVSGLDRGGGKGVIIGDPRTDKTEALLRAYGRFIEGLNGRYLTAEDVGSTQDDMDLLLRETRHVTGISESLGGSGDPSPATAWGVLAAMRAVAEHRWGDASLAGRHVVISGVGKVGSALAAHLVEEGARVTVADLDAEATARVAAACGTDVVGAAVAHTLECDIFSPCALGGALSAATIPELGCAAVVGCANNQLAAPEDAGRLRDRGIVYAPDYVANAGGVINIAEEADGYDRARAYRRIEGIRDTTRRVLAAADQMGTTTAEAADRLAEQRIDDITRVRLIRTHR